MKYVEVMPNSLSLDIQPLENSVYYAMVEEYVNRFSRNKGVLCIGQFGSLGAPGISDIDLLVVCEDKNYREIELHSKEFVRQSPLHRYLFWHDVAVVPQSAIRYLRYIHSLDDLKIVWGKSDILESCEQPDEIITLFRTVLWNSYFWSLLLHLCQQDSVSLRLILMLSKNALMSAANNYYLMANEQYAKAITPRAQQERQRVLSAHPSDQSDLAKMYFGEAIQTLFKSDWDLSNWMIRGGLSLGKATQKKIRLSQSHVIVFDSSYESRQEVLHYHNGHIHFTCLPSFYYMISCLIAQPYLQLKPELSKVWSMTKAEYIGSTKTRFAVTQWYEALIDVFNGLKRAGADPRNHELVVFPFSLTKQPISTASLYVRKLINVVRKYL